MRIVFFNRSFYPEVTATSQILTELCEDLIKDYGCGVCVVTGAPLNSCIPYSSKTTGRVIKEEDLHGIGILRVKSTSFSQKHFLGRTLNYLTYFIFSFFASFKLKKPDLVITLTDPPIISLIGLLVSHRFDVPLIISVQDLFPEAAKGLGECQSKIINFFLDYITRFCLKKADHIIALGKIMRKRIIEKGIEENKISIISNWADCENIFPVAKKNPFSLKYNIADSFVIMYIGNIGASAGLETVVYSADLLKNYQDILFVFVGEGIMKDNLIELANGRNLENVKFIPNQFKDMLSYAFSSADISVIPLKKGLAGYSVPSKIYKILASGRPYIACVDGDSEIAEITKRFECGWIAKPEDPRDLKEKIIFSYENKDLRQKMGENARQAAVFFDRKIGTKSYYELFKRLLNDKKSI